MVEILVTELKHYTLLKLEWARTDLHERRKLARKNTNIVDVKQEDSKFSITFQEKMYLSEVGFEPTPGEPDCDLNAAP